MQEWFTRTIIGLVLAALVIACNYHGPVLWSLLVLLVVLFSCQEFFALCQKMRIYPAQNLVYFCISLFVLLPLFFAKFYSANFVYVFALSLLLCAYVLVFLSIILRQGFSLNYRFVDLSSSLWAIFHLGLLPSFLTWIRLMDAGFEYILMILVAVALNDTGSMVFGKLFGKVKLAPVLSPGKTVIGSIGGLLIGSLSFVLLAQLFGIHINEAFWAPVFVNFEYLDYELISFVILMALAFLLAVVAQIGDLLVSALKRAAAVKDTGQILLSHGGVLDRIDSHIFVTWFAFFVFAYLLQ